MLPVTGIDGTDVGGTGRGKEEEAQPQERNDPKKKGTTHRLRVR